MDNNFSNILDIFKRLDEGAMSELHAELSDVYNKMAPGIEKYKDSFKAGQLYDALEAVAEKYGAGAEFNRMCRGAKNSAHMDYDTNPGGFENWFWYLPFDLDVAEGAKFPFANPKQKPGDQWRGTDAGTPGNKLVGASEADNNTPPPYAELIQGTELQEEDLEEQLRKAWEGYLAEFGAGNPGQAPTGAGGTGSPNPIDQQKAAKELQQTQSNLNKLKSAGVNLPTSVGQASQAAVKASNNPTANPTQTDKKVSMGLGQEIEKLLTTGDNSQIGQVANVLKQVKQQGS